MEKHRELNDPASCWNKAEFDEPVFVLLGRDAAAPITIVEWANARINLGLNQPGDPQIIEAMEMAHAMSVRLQGGKRFTP